MAKEYKIEIDARILELLGPNLYTNIYYVLAELIANAYDADAHNVYIISEENAIRVEDDGKGMSYKEGGISKYLGVAKLSRTDESNSVTVLGRKKMGRKGIGKLAALSVSENVDIMTVANGEKSGFVLSRHPGIGGMLTPIDDEAVSFQKVHDHGTAIVMRNPEYSLHKTTDAIKRNIVNIFPLIDADFRIHIINTDKKDVVIERLDDVFAKSLCSIITLGDDYKYLTTKVKTKFVDKRDRLIEAREAYSKSLRMKNNIGEEKDYMLTIEGWIGAYETTKGRKKNSSDFPDNFISLYANKKMGEFNILPKVGKNKLNESYVVGQLYVDLFELSELSDMALSNRQGYKSDDLRYETVIDYVRKILLPEILNKRVLYAILKNADNKKKQLFEQKKLEDKLKRNVEGFKRKAGASISSRLNQNKNSNWSSEEVEHFVDEAINDNIPDFGLKSKVDKIKKKVLISQTRKDKVLSDLIYHFLLYNGMPTSEILYSNCDDEVSRIPDDVPIFDYLREFFVNSYSNQKIYVIFVTSKNIVGSFGTMAEIGAAWITKADHKIMNINKFRPERPLNDSVTWQTSLIDKEGNITMDKINADLFCSKVEDVCRKLGYAPKDRNINMSYLESMVEIVVK